MRSSPSLLGLAAGYFGALASAHTVFTNLYVNDVNQGDGTCIRMPKDGATSTGPIVSPFSNPAMACGRDGQDAVAFTCPAPAGAKLTFEFREYADFSQPGAIDKSHKGPIAIYLKPVSSFADPASGDGWFKIWDEGYDSASAKFATEKLIANDGLLSVELPPKLPTGNYLVRTEIITLQNITETRQGNVLDAQFYSGCAQLFIQGDSAAAGLDVPEASKATIPGHLSPGDPGLLFNIYDEPLNLPYVVPGPKVFFPGAGTTPKIKAAAPLPESQGGVPPNCLLKNANWCGFEVASYTTETGCWAAVEDCYQQVDVCYQSSPPSGSRNCDVWARRKCDVIRDACDAGRFSGPPNKDQKLDESLARDVPASAIPAAANQALVPDSGGGSSSGEPDNVQNGGGDEKPENETGGVSGGGNPPPATTTPEDPEPVPEAETGTTTTTAPTNDAPSASALPTVYVPQTAKSAGSGKGKPCSRLLRRAKRGDNKKNRLA